MRAVKGIGSVDQTIVQAWSSLLSHNLPKGGYGLVRPIREEQRAEILVKISSCRSIDQEGTIEAIRILKTEVRMIPSPTILGGLELV